MARTALKAPKKGGTPVVDCEVKVSLPESDVRQVMTVYALHMGDALARDIYFFDTPDFALNAAGLVLRCRKTAREPDDVTVKLRPMKGADLAPSWLAVRGLKDETDIVGTQRIESVSLTVELPVGKIDHVVIGQNSLASLFPAVQQDLIAQYAKVQPDWSKVAAFGPVQARIWKMNAPGFHGPVTIELWRLPNNRRVIEFSYKAPVDQAADVQHKLDDLLAGHGFHGDAGGDTKTRLAVRFFKGERSPG